MSARVSEEPCGAGSTTAEWVPEPVGQPVGLDAYVELLARRRDDWATYVRAHHPEEAAQAGRLLETMPLERFVLAADVAHLHGPQQAAPPRREPRHFTAADYQARIDRDEQKLSAALADLESMDTARVPGDPAVVNVAVSRRAPTDAQLDRHRKLTGRVSALRSRIALNRARVSKLEAQGT